MNKKKKRIIFGAIEILILALIIFIFVWGIVNYTFIEENISKQLEASGLIGIFIASFLLDLIPQYVSPHSVILTSKLFGFDFIKSFLLVIIGSSIGSILGYEIGYFSRNRSDLPKILFREKIVRKVHNTIHNGGKWIVTLAAISPIPYVPILLGVFGLNRKNFLIYGVIPRIIGYFIFGTLVYFIL
jgi:membrane protein YqaA with SNARE-associated domain